MSRMVGTVSRGVRAPIIRTGDNLVDIVTDSILEAAKSEGYEIRNKDIIAMTESIVARAQGNYAESQRAQRRSSLCCPTPPMRLETI